MANDPAKRQSLIDYCNTNARKRGMELPAVTIEQFFDGNDDSGSFMCNLPDAGSLDDIRQQLVKMRDRPDVQALMIRVYETMEEDEDSWPFAEQIILVTSLTEEEVRDLFPENMAPDEVWEPEEKIPGIPAPPPGSKGLVAWWD